MSTSISSTSITFPDNTTQTTAFPMTGSILMWPGPSNVPSGYLICDGNSYNTTTYSNLFAVIGYRYGGSGIAFNTPNLGGAGGTIGSTPIGGTNMPSNTITVNNVNTSAGGANILTNQNIVHRHTFSRNGFLRGINGTAADNGNSTSYSVRDVYNQLTTDSNTTTPTPFYPSYTTVRFIIKH